MTGLGGCEPRWIRAVAFGSASAAAAFGAIGLALAIAGVYRPLLVLPLGAAAWLGLLFVARPILRAPGGKRPADHLAGAAAVAFVGAIGCWNALHASQHVVINRDGGVYANAGRWIARQGTLRVVANAGPFASEHGLRYGSIGVFEDRHHVLSFQFAHLLPTLLAELRQVGGDRLMFAAPALLGALALLALFVAAWRFLRNGAAALGVIVAFAFLMPEVSFSRDTVSEIPSQLLLFTALWLLADRRALRNPRTTLVAGVFLGLLAAARIDALLLLMGLPILFAVTWLLADVPDRRSVARSAGACAAGIAPGLALGFIDVAFRSTRYLDGLRGNVQRLAIVTGISIALAFAIVAIAPRLARRWRPLPPVVPWLAAAVVASIGFAAWFVRPHLDHARLKANPVVALHQAAANIAVDPTRAYWERSMVWIGWYLGPLTVAAAIVAAAMLTRALLRRNSLDALAGIALLGPAGAMYLWRASAFPDHVWVDRRFLDSALPLFTILAFGLIVAVARWRPASVPRAVPLAAAFAVGAVAVLFPIAVVAPVRAMTEQRGNLDVIDDACRILGPRSAVVVLQTESNRVDRTAPPALRGWCGADVAVRASGPPDRAQLTRLARAWAREGKTLWVAAGDAATIQDALPDAPVATTRRNTNRHMLRSTLLRRPSAYTSEWFAMTFARVPTA